MTGCVTASKPFIAKQRSRRFPRPTDAIAHIERHNCAGCAIPVPADVLVFGPGGCCPIICAVAVGDGATITALDDRTGIIRCLARQENQTPAVDQLPLFEIDVKALS